MEGASHTTKLNIK